MQSFTSLTAVALPLVRANIDTDAIIPSREMKGVSKTGLKDGLFAGWRYTQIGGREPDPSFALNDPAYQGCQIMLGGENFGCGSSREHAVWGLKQMGIRALIGSSFAGIFYDNCQRNGVLLITLEEAVLQRLGQVVSTPDSALINVDLDAQEIRLHTGQVIPFEIDTLRKTALLLGLDAIGSTLQRSEQIKAFERNHLAANPWLS